MKKLLAAMSLFAAVLACEPAARTIEPGMSPASGALAITRDDARIVIASEDHNEVLIIDRQTKETVGRVGVAAGPSHVIIDGQGRALVTSRYGQSVTVIDVQSASVVKVIEVGVEPIGLTELDNGQVAVVLAGEAALAIVDVEAGLVRSKIELADKDPRAVARLPDGSLYVSHMSTGALSRVRLEDQRVTRVDVTTRNDFGPRIAAEHLRSLTVDTERQSVLMAHTQANSDTVRAPIDDPNVPQPPQGGCGYSGCASELGAVVPAITEVGTTTDSVVTPQSAQNAGNREGGMADCFDCFVQQSANPPSVLNQFESRFTGVQFANPTALALFDGGRGQLVVNLGTQNALLLRRDLDGTARDVVGQVRLGHGAQSVVLSNDGAFAYVWNQFDGTVSEIELPQLDDDTGASTRFVPNGAGEAVSSELGLVPEYVATTFAVVEDALESNVSLGRKMFHDASDARISASGTVSCASCHPDGRSDNQTWRFTFGPRNTPQLGGGILDTAPFHWPGDVADVAALNEMTVLPFMGGNGLDPQSFELVASFIDTIKAAPSVIVGRQGQLNEAELRGKAIFESAEANCTACHAGNHMTDNVSYDVGTRAGEQDIAVFQTPVLHGLARSAPYLHDGSARTLRDMLDKVVKTDKMGVGSHLTDAQLDDLAAYLATL